VEHAEKVRKRKVSLPKYQEIYMMQV